MLRHRPVPLSGSNPSVTSTLDAGGPPHERYAPSLWSCTDRQTQGTAGNPAGGPGEPAGCGPARAAGSWVGSCHRDALSRSLCSSAQHPRHRQKLETLTVGRVHSQPALAPGASDLKTRRQMAFFFCWSHQKLWPGSASGQCLPSVMKVGSASALCRVLVPLKHPLAFQGGLCLGVRFVWP